jgi:hypothetical protein
MFRCTMSLFALISRPITGALYESVVESVQIKIKTILWIVIAIEKRAEPLGISKSTQRTK